MLLEQRLAMEKNNTFQIEIPPISEKDKRPRWSVMIPTYNCANYLRETHASVLEQDPGPDLMQIEVIDDCSTKDDPRAVVEELGRGRVGFYQQKENVGYIRNFETCLLRSRGHLIHLLHGDDYVRDGFYRKMEKAFATAPEIGYAFCRHLYMDEQGHWHSISPIEQAESGVISDWLEKIASCQRLTTPSVVVRREVYEQLGGFDRRFICAGEDWEMWVRIATRYPVWFEVEPMAVYRVKRQGSLTSGAASTGKVAKDMYKATEIIETYLGDYLGNPIAKQVIHRAREVYATWALEAANKISIKENASAFLFQCQEAVKYSRSRKIIYSLISVFAKKMISSI